MNLTTCHLCQSTRVKRLKPFGRHIEYQVVECRSCHAQRVDPFPSQATLAAFYHEYHHSDITEAEFESLLQYADVMARRLVSYTKGWATGSRPPRFVDVGGASGFLAVAMSRYGVLASTQDVSSNAARYVAQTGNGQVTILNATLDELVQRGERFDLVNASQVIEHVVDVRAFLDALVSLCEPGGLLFLDTPNNEAIIWKFKNAVRHYTGRSDFYNALRPPEHLWGFTKTGLHALFQQCGLRVLGLTDYGLGDPAYQPASRAWYRPLGEYVRLARGHYSGFNTAKQVFALADRMAFSRLLHRGGGLSAVLAVPSSCAQPNA
jgi:SAM-dependent methyltransferase